MKTSTLLLIVVFVMLILVLTGTWMLYDSRSFLRAVSSMFMIAFGMVGGCIAIAGYMTQKDAGD